MTVVMEKFIDYDSLIIEQVYTLESNDLMCK